jgi:hypothetical protein
MGDSIKKIIDQLVYFKKELAIAENGTEASFIKSMLKRHSFIFYYFINFLRAMEGEDEEQKELAFKTLLTGLRYIKEIS